MAKNYHSKLRLDIETYSPVPIKHGLYAYASSCEVLLMAYSIDDGPIEIVDLTKDQIPDEIVDMIHDENVLKIAYNAQFERICLSYHFRKHLSPKGWYCSMVAASYQGAVGSLAQTSELLAGSTEKQKIGRSLITYFCVPCKPTKTNDYRTRNLPEYAPDKWEQFKEYCRKDVEAEGQIPFYCGFEYELYQLDQRINDRGFRCNWKLVENAIEIDEQNKAKAIIELKEITGLDNPNSQVQLCNWLSSMTGDPINSIAKDKVEEYLDTYEDKAVRRALELRQLTSSSSTSKFNALNNAKNKDGKVRGTLAFNMTGTGRWAGRVFQPQNLPRNESSEKIHGMVEMGEIVASKELKGLVRQAIVGDLLVADFSAIEARVIAWLADEKWRMDVFAGHGKIYEASASMMFGVDIDTIVEGNENYEYRKKGKVAELALGYQGAVGAMVQFGALDMGLTEDGCLDIVKAWRATSPNIVKFWYSLEDAAKYTILNGKMVKVGYIRMKFDGKTLCIKLPSGRKLAYYNARLVDKVKFGKNKTCIVYDRAKQGETDTYGGKLCENITQSVARDCLATAMLRLDNAGYRIILHIHDEVVCERQQGHTLQEMIDIMRQPIEWAPGLLLNADGFEDTKYHK